MSDEEIPIPEPEYPADLHPEVVSECRDAWTRGRPWTEIRVIREGVDASEGASCGGSQGSFHLDCREPVEGVQYSSARGCPQWSCERHALEQIEWDRAHYDDPPNPREHEFTPEEQREIERILSRGRRRKEPEFEEEIDP